MLSMATDMVIILFLVSQLWLYLGNSQVSVFRTIGPLVEHVWDELNRRVRRLAVAPHNLRDIEQALTQEWRGIPQTRPYTELRSLDATKGSGVLLSRGCHTRY